MVFGAAFETAQGVAQRPPRQQWVDQPHRLKQVAVDGGGGLGRLGGLAAGGCVPDRLIARRGGCGRGVGGQPAPHKPRTPHPMTHQDQVMVGGPVQVTVKQVRPYARIGSTHPREAGGRDLAGVMIERGVGLAADVGATASEQLRHTHRRRRRAALEQAHRPHPQRDDATGAGVGGRDLRRRRPGQQEGSRPGAPVHRPPHEIPRRRVPLPFVDEDRSLAPHESARIGLDEGPSLGIVQVVDGASPLQGGRCLAHSPGPLKTYSR